MRLIAAITTLLTVAGAALAGLYLREVLIAPALPTDPLPVAELAEAPQEVDGSMSFATDPMRWPPVFGELQPPAPPAPDPEPVAAPAPEPRPPMPPIESLGYKLKGLVRSDTAVWALVSHPTGERIMRVGDSLAEGIVISRIDAAGVWLDTGADELVLLGFAEQ